MPAAALPRVYDPPGHVVVAAGQDPVTAGYPDNLGGTGMFDPGWRAARLDALLRAGTGVTAAGVAAVQSDVTDQLAARALPAALGYLRGARLSGPERAAARLLAGWNGQMSPDSAGAAIWWAWWDRYLARVFGPWWGAAKVPVRADRAGLAVSASQLSLDTVLARWTVSEPSAPAFTAPGGPRRTAGQVLAAAFRAAVRALRSRLGPAETRWAWGRLNRAGIRSLTLAPGLGAPPRPVPGDPWTVGAAPGPWSAATGPSLRLVVGWAGAGRPDAMASYPGGQSDNPVSPWYLNLTAGWRHGRYLPLAAAGPALATWRLRP
jgi:penicillin amidase